MSVFYSQLDQLSLTELLAITLCEKPDSDAVLGIVRKFGSLQDLIGASMEELTEVRGVGTRKAAQLRASLEFGRRLYSAPTSKRAVIRQPDEAAALLMPDMRYLDREQFRVLMLNTKNQVLAMDIVSIGSLAATIVHPREVFLSAIRRSASSVILAHNHPSGDPKPSKEDMEITKRLTECGRILGIEVLDHLIIGDNRWESLKQKGLI